MTFLWGSATSSHQIEGNNRHNDWWKWEHAGNIEGGVTSGRATDHWNLFREDLYQAAALGMNSYRFSVEWSRWEPEEGRWDPEAVEWYREVVGECERLKLLPMLTLHHFTLPQWLAERGGFTADDAPEKFGEFARRVVAALGSRIPLWCTVNEPMSLAVGGYLGAFMPPAKNDARLAGLALRQMFAGHVRAYDAIHSGITRREGPWKDHPVLVGIAHNLIDFHPLRGWHPAEVLATRLLRRFYNQSWPEAVMGHRQRFGVRGLMPFPRPVVEGLGRRTVDFLGINYYFKLYVRVPPYFETPGVEKMGNENIGLPISVSFSRPGDTTSDLGWTIHPEGLGRMIRFLSRYGVPLYVTENGIADRDDRHRSRYLLSHLREIAEANAAGADVRGYFHWSLLDNFEWVKGFGPRFGLLEVDYETLRRNRRPSADVYREIVRRHAPLPGHRPDAAVLDDMSEALGSSSESAGTRLE